MSTVETTPRKKRRWLLLSVPVVAVAVLYLLLVTAGNRRLQRAVADAERDLPGWRLDDIVANREPVPDDENSAVTIAALKLKVPPVWPYWDFSGKTPEIVGPEAPPRDERPEPGVPDEELYMLFADLRPNVRLTIRQADALRIEMYRAEELFPLLDRLAEQPRGRIDVAWSKDFISTPLNQVQDSRHAAQILTYRCLNQVETGDLEGALRTCRAIMNVSRCMADVPTYIGLLVRIAIVAIAHGRMERILGHGEPPTEMLEALQKEWLVEANEPLGLFAARGERGGMDLFFDAIERGDIKLSSLRGVVGQPTKKGWGTEEAMLYVPGQTAASRAVFLERMNQVVEALKLPDAEQADRLDTIDNLIKSDPYLVRALFPALQKVTQAGRRSRAMSHAAAAALGAELYRRKHGRWPATLEDLVPDFLPIVAADPFDGKPLRFRHDALGVVVYSTGMDRTDDGGSFETLNTHKPGTDIGFRVWNVDKRRQTAEQKK